LEEFFEVFLSKPQTQLHSLDLSYSGFEVSLTPKFLRCLRNLPGLKWLSLDGIPIIPDLDYLKKMEVEVKWDFDECDLSEDEE